RRPVLDADGPRPRRPGGGHAGRYPASRADRLHPLAPGGRPYPARESRRRSPAMSERKGIRYGLFGLGLILLIGLFTYIANRNAQAPTLAQIPAPSTSLQSLAALDGQAPAKRTIDIQHWQTAEGARVLFVEA